MNILIIEDDHEVAEVLDISITTGLSDSVVDVASDGVIAFGKCCKKKYDLILTDYKMPNINGTKAAKYIITSNNSLNKETPFIILSAYVPELEEKANFDFASHVLTKPCKSSELIEVIKKYLPNTAA